MLYWLVMVVACGVGFVLCTRIVRPLGEEKLLAQQPAKINRMADNARALAEGHPENVRFDARIRGYDPTQVDAVIDALRAEIDRLRAELG